MIFYFFKSRLILLFLQEIQKCVIFWNIMNIKLFTKGKIKLLSKKFFYRYASLYFILLVDKEDNELLALEVIHHYVELLDKYFGNVCELDIIFNFHKAYYILDEVVLGGYL